jgi:hypothetical protein
MKNVLAITLLCLLSLSLAAGQASKTTTVDQIKKYEQDWAQAVVKEGAASVDQYESDDILPPTLPAALPARPKTRRI